MPYPNEHAARVRNPSEFEEGSFRSKLLPNSKGVRMILGKLKGSNTMTVQAYRFPADKYTVAEAKAWLKENDVKYILFEPASNQEMNRRIRGK